ncbi:MAG: alpha/beta hydrolase [Ruminococcus sp.]
MSIIIPIAGGCVAAAAGITAFECAYFYRRTMKRNKAKTERTMKMSGTDWNQYLPFIEERKEYLLAQPHSDVFIKSRDGLKLHGTYFPVGKEDKVAICFHGYTSQGMKDYIALSGYYIKRGYSLLLVDERAHGESEGEYIGFGYLDRYDALGWIDFVIEKSSDNVQILLHGTSMGGATVLMASGLNLPKQVKGIISDCGFTSAKYVFTHVLHSMYHLPAFPVIQITSAVNRKKAGYGMDDCNAAREVRKAKVPILLIHGDADFFVPCSMCDEIYENCASPKKKLIVKGASHAESYYKNTEAYENAMNEFIGGIINENT